MDGKKCTEIEIGSGRRERSIPMADYDTVFAIKINATLDRKNDIAEAILLLQPAANDSLLFKAEWPEWKDDILKIQLNPGESISLEGRGPDKNFWRATVTRNKLVYELPSKTVWTRTRNNCFNDVFEHGERCCGCDECGEWDPTYE